MRKKLASLALLFGLLTAVFVGTSGIAQANPPLNYTCNNTGGVNVVTCSDVLSHVKLKITGNRVLTGNELHILSDSLNGTLVNFHDINLDVLNIYNSFNPQVAISKIQICILSLCH